MTTLSRIETRIDTPVAGSQPAHYVDRFVQAGPLRLHYLDYGKEGRTPILCVHGGAAHAHWFDYVAGSFNGDHHVLALDLRGHGDSAWVDPPAYSYEDYASDLARVAEALDLRDFVLIGHSMGGMVSLLYATRYPGRVKKLVVVDTSINLSEDRINAMRERGSRPGTDYASRGELIARFRLRPGSTLATHEVVHYVAGYGARQFPDGVWRHKFDRSVYAIREKLDGMPLWGQVKIPALLVKGGRSERVTPEIQAEVKRRCPHVEFAEVANSDHHVTLDNPSGFVQAVKGFLARHP
jgi:pimeloyl-ACP methyl ester carboxylesterase